MIGSAEHESDRTFQALEALRTTRSSTRTMRRVVNARSSAGASRCPNARPTGAPSR